ncbi:hypothetical protein ACQ46_gp239 [Citrobacter phage Moon]|uniref:Uncharacterized protein n=1 Tax=Citrobacter phage Moon TaxID=1540095 RepID=A0A0A0YVN0_9CAUD|nr:hypothetical protein ACQ46_gp239 [Citrobacter phage Moon]AIX12185.1 hypothetical protein CPT_Moon214 [Citrobacter phage Moon]
MKSIFRINGVEAVVEGVIPVSEPFNEAVQKELEKLFNGHDKFIINPLNRFGMKDKIDDYINGVVKGEIEGEFPVAVTVIDKDESICTVPAFILFRK